MLPCLDAMSAVDDSLSGRLHDLASLAVCPRAFGGLTSRANGCSQRNGWMAQMSLRNHGRKRNLQPIYSNDGKNTEL